MEYVQPPFYGVVNKQFLADLFVKDSLLVFFTQKARGMIGAP